MKYDARIEVSLKPGYKDPEGETTARLLKELGYPVGRVTVSKIYNLVLETESKKIAGEQADEICKRLLTNPTKDNYKIVIEEER